MINEQEISYMCIVVILRGGYTTANTNRSHPAGLVLAKKSKQIQCYCTGEAITHTGTCHACRPPSSIILRVDAEPQSFVDGDEDQAPTERKEAAWCLAFALDLASGSGGESERRAGGEGDEEDAAISSSSAVANTG